jgi:hypothetical protein
MTTITKVQSKNKKKVFLIINRPEESVQQRQQPLSNSFTRRKRFEIIYVKKENTDTSVSCSTEPSEAGKDTRRKKQFEVIYVKKENTGTPVSCSTEPSIVASRVGKPNTSSRSSSIERKSDSLVNHLKEEAKQDIVTSVNSNWERSLKKISKEEAERNKASMPASAMTIVTVKKTLPPREPEVVEWPLKSAEEEKKKSRRWVE